MDFRIMAFQTIGILGGAFDPIHRDHLRIAECALRSNFCDQVWLVPSPDRDDKSPKASAEHRLQMLRIACDGRSGIEVCDLEITWGYRGTLAFLDQCARVFPQKQFRLIIGADSYPRIPGWICGDELLRRYSLIVFPRRGYAMPDPLEHQAKGYASCFWCRLGGEEPPGVLASSQLRERLWTDVQSREALPQGVWNYIAKHRLYVAVQKDRSDDFT